MSVEAFTVDGKVTLNTEDFDSAISNLVRKLDELKDGLSNLGIHTTNFTNELSVADKQFNDIKGSVTGVETEVKNMVNNISEATNNTNTLNSELNVARESVSALTNETSTLNYNFSQFTSSIPKAVEQVQVLNNEFNAMRYYVDMAKAEETALLQIEQKRIDALTKLQSDESKRIQHLHNIIDYLHMEEQQMEANASIQRDIILRLEREEQKRQEIMQKTLNMAKRELSYLEQQHQAELKIYDDIVKRYEAQGRFVTGIQEELGLLAERNATEEQELIHLDNQLMLQKSINTLVAQGGAENIKSAETLMKQLDTDTNIYHILEKEIMAEKEKLALLEEQDAVLKKQTADREKQLATSRKGNDLDKMSYLPRRIGSMALTMWGFNEIMDIYDKAMQNINAYGSQKTYADLMRNDSRYLTQTKQDVNDINTGVKELNKSINESYKGSKSLQQMYQKVDMQSVGANAMDTAFKYGVQAENLDELAEVMAIYGSEFVRQGRSQEDSILAVNDALDGEIRRLKEVGIDREDLEAKGWKEGDTMSMINALREIAEERGYDVVAQKVTNLSDAITVLEIRIAQDLVGAFKVLEPFLTEVANDFIFLIGKLEEAWIGISNIGKGLKGILDDTFGKDNVNNFGSGLLNVSAWVVTLGISFAVLYKIVKSIVVPLKDLLKIGKDAESIGGAVAKDTGGIGKTMNNGGFRENFSSEWGKLGKNLGKMARVFVELAVAMAMAFALIEEGILLISAVGYTYESLKPQFNQGIEFIKEFGLWFALLGGAMIGLSYALDKIPQGTEKAITKGAKRLAYGMAIAMGLIAEAIGLLILPMTAIALLGGTASFLGTNLDKGLEVISWIGNALHQIDLPMALFIGGFLAVSLLLGLVQPLTIGLAVGIASALLLVTEAIVMLIPPLGAIALLGGTASMLGEDNIKQGAETIAMIGRVLSVLADAMVDLVVVDLGVFADRVLNFATQLVNGGKDAMTTLTEDILPSLRDFIKDFNAMDFSVTIDSAKVQAVTTMAEQIPPMFRAVQKLTSSLGGGGFSVSLLGGLVELKSDSGLGSKLDALYEDIRAVMDFARKLGGLSTANGGANSTAITQTANAIAQLKVKLNLFITTISSASSRVQSASQRLGSALTTGFKTGSASFNSTVVSVLAKGISEVQSKYATFNNGGKALGQKLVDGFKNHKPTLKSIVAKELQYALQELDSKKDDFYTKGQALGKQLSDGFESSGGLNVGSPANIARTIAKEMEYSMLALDNGKQLMYKGGQALGQALTNGYQNYGNLMTDVGVLASKGVSNEQLQANAKNIQLNGNQKGKTPQLTQTNINIDMSNSTVIGVQDLDNKIRQAVEKAIVSINSPNGAIGY